MPEGRALRYRSGAASWRKAHSATAFEAVEPVIAEIRMFFGRERQGVGLHRLGAAPYQEISLTLTQCIYDIIQPFRFGFRHQEECPS